MLGLKDNNHHHHHKLLYMKKKYESKIWYVSFPRKNKMIQEGSEGDPD